MTFGFWRWFRMRDLFARRREPAPVPVPRSLTADHLKPGVDSDGRQRRMRQMVEDNRLI